MLKLFIKNFKITLDNIILSAPLIIFVSIISCYLNFAKDYEDTITKALFTVITTIVLISAFLCIWFYTVKKVLKLTGKEFVYNQDRTNALKDIVKSIPKCFSKYFLPFIGIISAAMMFFLICYNFVDANLPTKIVNLVENINNESIELKDLIIFISVSFLAFWGLLWIPEVLYSELNPFKALVYSIKKIFMTLPQSILLYIYIYLLFIILHQSVIFLMTNPFLYFVVLLLYYYFAVYVTILLFRYYEEKFLG